MSLEIQDFFCWKPSLIWAFFVPLGWQTKNPWHIEPCCGFQVGRYRGCGRQFSTVYSQYIAQVLNRNFAFRHLFTSKQHCKTLQHCFWALKETSKHHIQTSSDISTAFNSSLFQRSSNAMVEETSVQQGAPSAMAVRQEFVEEQMNGSGWCNVFSSCSMFDNYGSNLGKTN